ncbi:MAG: hypothetical protein S4CHLAM37_07510 [Chlamydiia bacterium]|nr:hypothetical protein [Chlamydiia bacterium]
MSIKIANRFKPFTHEAGAKAPLPLSSYTLEAFPSFFRVFDENEVVLEINFGIQGPVDGFTLMQDIEKAKLYVYGTGAEGFFRFSLSYREEKLTLKLDRAHKEVSYSIAKIENLSINCEIEGSLSAKDELVLQTGAKALDLLPLERLSFGNHKKQDATLIRRRNDPKEFLPLWFALGQRMQKKEAPEIKEDLLTTLSRGFSLCFSDLFAKSTKKPEHLGFTDITDAGLYEGYELIRTMLVYEENDTFHLLKKMPHLFHCGRVVDLKLKEGVFIDIEWSKKSIKKLHIRSQIKTSLTLSFQKSLRTCRESSPKGASSQALKRVRAIDDAVIINVKVGTTYLDRFQK